MDSITVQRLITEAFKQSPNNTQSNGYGFGLAVVVVVGVVCVTGIIIVWRALRADNRRNWQAENDARIEARKQFRDDIAARFDRLELKTEKTFESFDSDSKADRERFADLDKRLSILEKSQK